MAEPFDKTQTLPAPVGDVAALSAGQTVLEYRIDKVLGGGGFGITYLAQDVNLRLPVAIKEYFPSDLAVRAPDRTVLVRSGEGATQFNWGLERFIDEARTLASFRHPNIVRVLRYFKENGTAYIVMEYESGHPLKRWVAQQPALDQKALLQVVYPLIDGLEAVHKLNFLHRDIKPDNIYIRADGTPVLLDFGAARRVSESKDITNIVSPGFAPFEQYHSKGNQGPWSDLYSLGAVMYWMVTGSKPMESAARVREDSMPKAVDTVSTSAFGNALLQAIDWALTPDETQRPQNVAAFRKALFASDPNAPVVESGVMRKNVMGSIVFLDLVAYSTHSVDQQVQIKAQFNEMIAQAIGAVNEQARIVLDTGDGAAICFLGDPEDALQSVLRLRDLMRQSYSQLALRVGLHLGPLRMMLDINQRMNVVGDGINVAQRIMDFSSANQIVVSRAYYDVITRISDGAARMFEYLGPRLDKHKRSHELYAVVDSNTQRSTGTEVTHPAANAPWADNSELLTPDVVSAIESELTRAIGPLAHVLVKKAVQRAHSPQGLREFLAVSIQDESARQAFVHPKSGSTTSRPFGRSGASGKSGNQSASRPNSTSGTHSTSVRSPSVRTDVSQPGSFKTGTVGAEQQAQLERALGQYIGPLSKTLVRKEAAKNLNWGELLQVLAQHIDRAQDREKFLAAAKKI
jgi:serine/threonine protein kinase